MISYKTNTKLRRWSANCALTGGLFAFASAGLGLKLLGQLTSGSADIGLLALPAAQAVLVSWSFAFSGLGNYLLLLPLALYLWVSHSAPTKGRRLGNFLVGLSGLAYLLLGAFGASLLAASWPDSIAVYQAAPAADQAVLAQSLLRGQQLIEATYQGHVQNLFGTFWLLGVAILHHRLPRPLIALTGLLACMLVATSVGQVVNQPHINQTGLALTMLLAPTWAVYMGLVMRFKLWRQSHDAAVVQEMG